jgi:hypothetical protein
MPGFQVAETDRKVAALMPGVYNAKSAGHIGDQNENQNQ